MSEPFDIEIDCGGAAPIHYKLSEDDLRQDPDPGLRANAIGAQDRITLRTVAFEKMKRIWTRPSPIITVVVDNAAYVIPTAAIHSIRLSDPEVAGERRPFGFVQRSENPQRAE